MFDSRWHKIVRELWGNKTRTILIVLSIAVGIFAFGSVFITQEVLMADMDAQYQAINPSTITFNIKSFDDSLVRWVSHQPDVTGAQGRIAYPVKLIKGAEEVNLDLYAADDYGADPMNQITIENGQWPLERGELLLERTSLSLSGGSIGRPVTVETPSGRKYDLVLAGTVHDLNAMPATMFPQLSGYVSVRTMGGLGLPVEYNRLSITVDSKYATKKQLEKIADDLKRRLVNNGVEVQSVQVREPGEHWARTVTQGFSLILTIIGLFSLALSGFLVVNTVTALLAEQKRHIGIMKAIGGTRGQIAGVYLVLVSVYGLLALIIALPVGMLLSQAFTGAVAMFLNIDILGVRMPPNVLAMEAGAALVVPLLASALPIFGGVRITVREAISNYGVKSKGESGLMARLLLKLHFLPRPFLLSLRNTFRRKGRLMLTLGTLTLAGTLFISVLNVRDSLTVEIDNIITSTFNYQVILALDKPYERAGTERKVERIPGVLEAHGQTGMSGEYIKPDGSKSATFTISGLAPETDFIRPEVVSGRWLTPSDRDSLVLSSKIANEMNGIKPGDVLTIWSDSTKHDWKVVGIAKNSFDRAGYADFDYVSSLKGETGLAGSILVRLDPKTGLSQAEMARRIESELKKAGVGVSQTMTKDVVSAANSNQIDFMIAFLLSMAAMTALIGGLGLAGMMSLNVMERTREIGVMRSIGARHGAIAGIISSEGLLIGVMSWAFAIPLSIPFSIGFNSMLGQLMFESPLPFAFSPLTLAVWLGIVTVICAAATLLPAYRATKMSVRETLAYE